MFHVYVVCRHSYRFCYLISTASLFRFSDPSKFFLKSECEGYVNNASIVTHAPLRRLNLVSNLVAISTMQNPPAEQVCGVCGDEQDNGAAPAAGLRCSSAHWMCIECFRDYMRQPETFSVRVPTVIDAEVEEGRCNAGDVVCGMKSDEERHADLGGICRWGCFCRVWSSSRVFFGKQTLFRGFFCLLLFRRRFGCFGGERTVQSSRGCVQ